jgi:hypothetical protein
MLEAALPLDRILIHFLRTTSPKPTVVTQSSQVSASGPVKVTIFTTKCKRLRSSNWTASPRSPLCSVK